jgi:hypothetical protein
MRRPLIASCVMLGVIAQCAAAAGGASLSGAITAPGLATTRALIVAGGGPADFKTLTLVAALAGSEANADIARLVARFGAPAVKDFIVTFDFVVADAQRLMKQRGIALPANPEPDPAAGKALSAALYRAGTNVSRGDFRVERMLDRLVSQPVRSQVMTDLDAHHGARAAQNYAVILPELLRELAGV